MREIRLLPPQRALKRVLRCARGGARPRPQCELRALERLLAPPCARARLEGQGGDHREPRTPAAIRLHVLPAAARDPPRDVCPSPTRSHAKDLAPCALRTRRLAVRLLRVGREQADARPRRPALAWRRLGLGERRHLVRALQHAQGQPLAGRDQDDPAQAASSAGASPNRRAMPTPAQATRQPFASAAACTIGKAIMKPIVIRTA